MSSAHSLPCSSSGCQRTLTKVTSVRVNEYPTYLNQSPSQIFEGLVLSALQTQKNKDINFWGENMEAGGNSHAVAPKLNSLTNNILDY